MEREVQVRLMIGQKDYRESTHQSKSLTRITLMIKQTKLKMAGAYHAPHACKQHTIVLVLTINERDLNLKFTQQNAKHSHQGKMNNGN